MKRAGCVPFDRLPVAAVLVDSGKRVLAANRLARKLTRSARLRRGTTCRRLLGCRLPERRCPLLRARARGGLVPRTEIPIRAGGRPGWVIERVSQWTQPDGTRAAALVWGPATAFHRRERRLLSLARADALTGTLNRRGFEDNVRRSLLRRRSDRRAALLMLDVDGLKRVNDSHGHAEGDLLLARLGAALRRALRSSDLAGRVGGDEFAVYCPGTSRSQAGRLARRIREVLERDNARHPSRPALEVSIGISCARRARLAALRAAADRSLYRDKARRTKEAGS